MKLVINRCFGGFSLSARAVKRLAELKGRPAYFFKQNISAGLRSPYIPIPVEQADGEFIFFAFDVPNPNEVLSSGDWRQMTQEQREQANAVDTEHSLDSRPADRADPDLVRVVEEMGEAANGAHAKLAIVEIPDGVEWGIDEYDGIEHIAESHRTWR